MLTLIIMQWQSRPLVLLTSHSLKFSESTLASMDTLTFNTAASLLMVVTYALDPPSMVNVAWVSTPVFPVLVQLAKCLRQAASSSSVDTLTTALTARVSAIDAGYTTTGDFAVFTTDGTTVICSSKVVLPIWWLTLR